MTEDEIQALKTAKEEAEKRASEAEIAAQAARDEVEKARGDLNNVVEEIKDLRAKKAEAEEKAKISNPEPGAQNQSPDVSELVRQELSKAEQERAKREIQQAVEEFKNSKTEFQADSTGLVFDKFQKELSKFNFSDITNKEQAKARLEEAYRFVKQTNPETLGGPEHEGTPRSATSPKGEDGRLPQDVERTVENAGMNPEKYRKLLEKYGDALNSLGFGS